MNRADRLLDRLRECGRAGVCLAEVPLEEAYTLRNAASEAAAAGHDIRSELCTVHHHRGTVRRYRLVEPPLQLDLIAGEG